MCRVFGCVSSEPISTRFELLEAPNPLIRQSENHDSGWGMAVYDGECGDPPRIKRFPVAAHSDPGFESATALSGRIFNVHVRRATLGGLKLENTHPFELGPYTFSHNGTVLRYHDLLHNGDSPPSGETDSEHLFNRLMRDYVPSDPIGSFRRLVTAVIDHSVFSGLNFLFSDGEKLYAYRLGVFSLYWMSREGVTFVASERLTDEEWHCVQQDVLVELDPDNPADVKAQRLVGDDVVARARIERLEPSEALTGEARGRFAADRAATLAGLPRAVAEMTPG